MIYIAQLIRETNEKQGLYPFINSVFTEEFNVKKPMEAITNSAWQRYSIWRDGVPVPENMRLPPKLILVCKGIKSFKNDFYVDLSLGWVVSDKFLKFLKKFNFLAGMYEQCELSIVSLQNKSIAQTSYFLLRLLDNNNKLIDFEVTPKVISPKKPLTKHSLPKEYYPDFVFQQGVQIPDILYLDSPTYWTSFLCSEAAKQVITDESFLRLNLFNAKEFVQEQLNREKY